MNLDKHNWRCELKFIVTNHSSQSIFSYIKSHPAIFSEIYYKRQVNNIYCDTLNFHNFSDNVIGNSDRLKVRIRWYGETFCLVEEPILEFKIKSGSVGRKEYFKMRPLSISKKTTANNLYQEINNIKVTSAAKKFYYLLSLC